MLLCIIYNTQTYTAPLEYVPICTLVIVKCVIHPINESDVYRSDFQTNFSLLCVCIVSECV